MKRKHWVIIVIFGCICLSGAFLLLRSQWQHHAQSLDITQAVPLDVVYLCYFDHAGIFNETFNQPSSGWSRFVAPSDPLLRLLRQWRAVASIDKMAGEVLQSNAVYSVHPQGKNSIAALYALALPADCSAGQWETLLKTGEKSIREQAYHGTSILSLGQGDSLLYTATVKRMALFSESLLLLQNAIRHVNSTVSLHDNEQFREVLKTSGVHTEVRLFVNHRALNALTTAAGSDKGRKAAALLPYMANWTALDGQMAPEVIHLNGFVFPSLTDDNYLSLLLSQNGADNTLWNLLPGTTALALNIGFADADRFLNGYKYFLEQHKLLAKYRNRLVTFGDQIHQNAADLFSSFYIKELGVAYVAGEPGGWLCMMKTANQKFVMEQLRDIANDLRLPWKVEGEAGGAVLYHNPAKGWLPVLFGDVFLVDDDYFTVKDNWIVFGSRPELLASLQSKHTTLKKQLQGTEASQYYSNNSILSVFVQPSGAAASAELLSYLHPSLQKRWARALQNERFKVAGLQMRPSGDKLYTTFFSVYERGAELSLPTAEKEERTATPAPAKQEEAPATVTATAAAAAPSASKYPVVNHIDRSEETLVQYDDHTIALLDKKGATLWSQPIDGPIRGAVHQIDFYQNGKLQMLFLTAAKLYLIDRKGNTVASYPVPLPSPAQHLAVFDYDNNRDYRVFIGFANRTVRVYDKKGLAVEGWKTFTAAAPLTRAPAFFRVGNRDFIVICDERTTTILDRRGEERLPLKAPVAVRPGTPITAQQQPPVLTVTATDGRTVRINMNNGTVN
jgi:hypothetical protein